MPIERRAVVATTSAAAAIHTNGATLRADEVTALLEATGHEVVRTTAERLDQVTGHFAVGVAVSYACVPAVRVLQSRAERVWLDACDSWLLVNGSGVRNGRPTYLLRALRDGARIAALSRPDLVTYISGADLAADRDTVRARQRLVLPGHAPAVLRRRGSADRRVVLAGDWAYPPNADGLRWFRRRILPALEQQIPGDSWSVAVYGTGLKGSSTGRVQELGYGPDQSDLYRDGDVHLAPVRFGGGVKRKVLHPLLAGLPVVTTPAGAHGLRPHPLLDVRDRPHGIAAALADRLQRPPDDRAATPADVIDRDDSAAVTAWLER